MVLTGTELTVREAADRLFDACELPEDFGGMPEMHKVFVVFCEICSAASQQRGLAASSVWNAAHIAECYVETRRIARRQEVMPGAR